MSQFWLYSVFLYSPVLLSGDFQLNTVKGEAQSDTTVTFVKPPIYDPAGVKEEWGAVKPSAPSLDT